MKRDSGFSTLETILTVVIVGLISTVGWYVWHNRQQDKTANVKTAVTKTAQQSTKPSTNKIDPTAGWKSYTDSNGHFTIKFPATWATSHLPENCENTKDNGVFMLGENDKTVGTCASDSGTQMGITWRTDKLSCEGLSSNWKVSSEESVTVSGVAATKTTAIYADADPAPNGLGDLPNGVRTVHYCFVANSKMYTADYTQRYDWSSSPATLVPDNQSVVDDFNLMITKTLKVN